MPLLAALGLKPTKKLADQAAAAQAKSELLAQMSDVAKQASTVTDAAAKAELLAALKSADGERKAVESLGDQSKRAQKLEEIKKGLQAKATAAATKLAKAMGRAVKPEEEAQKVKLADGRTMSEEAKIAKKAVFGAGKLGVGVEGEYKQEIEDGKGGKVERTAGFGGKGYVEVAEVPYKTPAQFEVKFVFSGEAKLASSKERKTDESSKKAKMSASAEIEFSIKHVFDTREMEAFRQHVKDGKAGAWPELKLAYAVVAGQSDALPALVAQVKAAGGSVSGLAGMKEGDEQELSVKVGAGADVSAGKKGFGFALGVSVNGSVTRSLKREGGKYVFTMTSNQSVTGKGGAGFAQSGAGMIVGKSVNQHEMEQVIFELDESHPKRDEMGKLIMAAKTLPELKALRGRLKDVPSYVTTATGGGTADSTGMSLLGGGLNVEGSSDFTAVKTVGPDGKVSRAYSGSNTAGASASVLGQTVAGATRTDAFVGGAGSDNQGFGQSSETNTETDLVDSAKSLLTSAMDSPLAAAGKLIGDDPLLKKRVQQEGVVMDDTSYARLVKLAAGPKRDWERYWCGAVQTYTDWAATREKVRKAGDDRQAIAKAIAEFEAGSSRGRHDTVRAAVAGTVIPFEFPDALKGRKDLFESLVTSDPLEELKGDDAARTARLNTLKQQIEGLRNDLGKHIKEFRNKDDCLDMCDRLDKQLERVVAELRKHAPRPAAKKEKLTSGGPAEEAVSRPDDAEAQAKREAIEARINALKRKISEAHQVEQATFAQWEKDNQGDTILGFLPTHEDQRKLAGHENELRKLYKKWDGFVAELRQALQEAGKPHDPAEADAVVPDRKRFTAVWKANPKAGYRMSNEPNI